MGYPFLDPLIIYNLLSFLPLTALYFPQAYAQRIYAIHNNHVTNEMRDTTVYNYLVIPSEVNYVNFTWKSGKRKYFYDFDRLQTLDESILKAPTLSINKHGRIPQEQKSKYLRYGHLSGGGGYGLTWITNIDPS